MKDIVRKREVHQCDFEKVYKRRFSFSNLNFKKSTWEEHVLKSKQR